MSQIARSFWSRSPVYLVLALAVTACLLSGCLVMHGSAFDESGVPISMNTLDQIEPGRTSERWLRATLGDPTEVCQVDERSSILRYDYEQVEAEGTVVFLIFAGGSEHNIRQRTYFEVVDGIVSRWWVENQPADVAAGA